MEVCEEVRVEEAVNVREPVWPGGQRGRLAGGLDGHVEVRLQAWKMDSLGRPEGLGQGKERSPRGEDSFTAFRDPRQREHTSETGQVGKDWGG